MQTKLSGLILSALLLGLAPLSAAGGEEPKLAYPDLPLGLYEITTKFISVAKSAPAEMQPLAASGLPTITKACFNPDPAANPKPNVVRDLVGEGCTPISAELQGAHMKGSFRCGSGKSYGLFTYDGTFTDTSVEFNFNVRAMGEGFKEQDLLTGSARFRHIAAKCDSSS